LRFDRLEGETTMRTPRLATIAAALLLAAAPALAIPITPSSFGSYQVEESFEGIALGTNVQLQSRLLVPGRVSAFTFASGVILSSPIPNPGVANGGPFVHNTTRNPRATNDWGANGVVDDTTDVPFGDSYLGAFHPTTGTVSFTLSFATPQDRVGAFVTGYAGSTITMEVFDAGGALLETVSANAVVLSGWATNFAGIQRPNQISRVRFSGSDFGIDSFRFEDDLLLVPEPSTLSALMLGLVGLWGIASVGRGRREPARVHVRVQR